MAARCQYCGEEVRPNSMFCLSCGQLVMRGQASPKASSSSSSAPTPATTGGERGQPTPVASPTAYDLPALAPTAKPAVHHASTPAAPVQQSRTVGPTRFALTLSTGDHFTITGAALIGRRPEEAGATEAIEVFSINDDTRSVSRVHLHVSIANGKLLVTDRSSANGTKVERLGVVVLCTPGTSVPVQPGDVLWFGDVRAEVAAG